MTQQMLIPGKGNWGLGLQIGGTSGNMWFSHGGVNEGYESLFVGFDQNGDGAAVMTNAQGGMGLASDVMSAIAIAYNWPGWQPPGRTEVKVDPAILARYVGSYDLAPGVSVTFTLEGDHLMTQITGQPKFLLYAESPTKFFLTVVDAEVEFVSNPEGKVQKAILRQGGQEHAAVRK